MKLLLIFLEFIKKEKKKRAGKTFFFLFSDHLHHSGSCYTVFPDGRFLLDASGRNLLLLVYCESLQHQQ